MESTSSLRLLAIVAAFTLALLGLCTQWDRIGLIAPFGYAELTPLIFIPLLLTSLYAAASWIGIKLSMPTITIRVASLLAIAACISVVVLLPAELPQKVVVASTLVAATVVLQIVITRLWFRSSSHNR